jgi:hypothetical protein
MANEILRSYSMDFTMQVEHAQRGDGQWFRRCQYRDTRYGYKWSAWQPVANGPSGHSSQTGRAARLPKGVA